MLVLLFVWFGVGETVMFQLPGFHCLPLPVIPKVVIPTLPRGRHCRSARHAVESPFADRSSFGRVLVFNCVSTWGDKDFVGLAGAPASALTH